MTFKGDTQAVAEPYRGKQTIWVEPQTKLIRRLETRLDGEPLVLEYSYGEPQIRDIYDLGVPRNAQRVEEVDESAAETHDSGLQDAGYFAAQ